MERREETDDGERRIQSEETEDMSICKFSELIPLDLIIDILLRLPAKSAVRFRCVSKLWSSILTRPDFIKWFSIQSSTRLCFLVCVKMRSNKRLFFSLQQPDTSFSHYQRYGYLQRYEIKSPESYYDCYKPLSKSVHGLLLSGVDVGETTAVWNPNTRQNVILPESRLKHKGCFLGYDPVEGKYKVLFIPARAWLELPLVLTLGPQESWRVIQNSPKHYAPPNHTHEYISVCINGNVYYEAELHHELDGNIKIFTYIREEILIRFDVRYETFTIIRKPDDPKLGELMLDYKGKLAWFCSSGYGSYSIRFWVLEDEEKQEWSLRKFILPHDSENLSIPNGCVFDVIWKEGYRSLLGITHDTDEFIFGVPWFDAIFYVLYYDPNRNRIRRVAYEGLWDAKDFENLNWRDIELYPNHSESLYSLENVPCYMPPINSE